MNISNMLLILAAAGTLAACKNSNSDTANPGDTAPPAEPAADDGMGDDAMGGDDMGGDAMGDDGMGGGEEEMGGEEASSDDM